MSKLLKFSFGVALFFVIFVCATPQVSAAGKCVLDTYQYQRYDRSFSNVTTYCSNFGNLGGCGSNKEAVGYDTTACPGPSAVCCAITTLQCANYKINGRQLYCSIDGGGNPLAPSEDYICNGPLGAEIGCFAGSTGSTDGGNPNSVPASLKGVCGYGYDTDKNGNPVSTFCADICGNGSVNSNLDTKDCSRSAKHCCANVSNKCGGCIGGRRTYCTADPRDLAVDTTQVCALNSNCAIGAIDSSCPAYDPTDTSLSNKCVISPYIKTDGTKVQTYCRSAGCNGGIVATGYTGCSSIIGSQCCISDQPFDTTAASTVVSAFQLCDQIPSPPNAPSKDKVACQRCSTPSSNGDPGGIWTAVGCIPTASSTQLIGALIRIGLGISGGVALLMILASAVMFSTSEGDQKRVTDARELLTSAVIGLLFVIFSVTILQFIGVSVLHIPGF